MASKSNAQNAGRFSSAKRLTLPVGPQIDPAGVRGYPIDMRVKAYTAQWPPVALDMPELDFVWLAQYGLGCFERWLAGDGEQWLQAAIEMAWHLVRSQQADGSWLNPAPHRHTFLLGANWKCAMAQGEGASLLVRCHLQTGEKEFASAALAALEPMFRRTAEGGACAVLDGHPWPEEYPTNPPSFVLNGAIFAWWGVRDVAVGLGDEGAERRFADGVVSLAANLERFDTGWWSLYCLYPHPVRPIASSFYHALHIAQLEAMHRLAPRPEFEAIRERWIGYFASASNRRRALAGKVLYRLVIPRNTLLGDRLPWVSPAPSSA